MKIKIIIAILVVILMGGLLAFNYKKISQNQNVVQNKTENSQVKQSSIGDGNKLFIAQSLDDGNKIRLGVFDPEIKKSSIVKEFVLEKKMQPFVPYQVDNSRYSSYTFFDKNTGDVYFRTEGNLVKEVSTCPSPTPGNEENYECHADGEIVDVCPKTGDCISYNIYRVNIFKNENPVPVYSSKGMGMDKGDDSIPLSNGLQIITNSFLSPDQTKLLQIGNKTTKIYNKDTKISVYSILDLRTGKADSGGHSWSILDKGNVIWSGDGKKLFLITTYNGSPVLLQQGVTGGDSTFKVLYGQSDFVWSSSPNGRYVAANEGTIGLAVFDTEKSRQTTLSEFQKMDKSVYLLVDWF